MAKAKLKQAIRSLTRHREPSGASGEVHAKLLSILDERLTSAARHRMIAVVGTTFLENALRKAIRAHLDADIDSAGEMRIFEEDHAPLNNFDARIRMARGLGIITQEVEEDLNWLKAIRNSFAHSLEEITFETKAIEDAFAALNLQKSPIFQKAVLTRDGKGKMEAARQFVIAVTLLCWDTVGHKPPWGRVLSAKEIERRIARALADSIRPRDGEFFP